MFRFFYRMYHYTYRRVGPKMYQTKAQRKAADYDGKHNQLFRIF